MRQHFVLPVFPLQNHLELVGLLGVYLPVAPRPHLPAAETCVLHRQALFAAVPACRAEPQCQGCQASPPRHWSASMRSRRSLVIDGAPGNRKLLPPVLLSALRFVRSSPCQDGNQTTKALDESVEGLQEPTILHKACETAVREHVPARTVLRQPGDLSYPA